MIKKFSVIFLSLFLPALVIAAVTDFVANSNVTISSVTFGAGTTNMIIMNGSTAQSWTFNNGVFTVINPGSAFNVGSSDSAVKSIQVTSGGSTLVCAANTTPGTSFATLPTTSGTYTVIPSTTTACTSLCTVLSNTATYNAFPTCGALTCNSGYSVSGSGSSAICAANASVATPVSSGGGAVSMSFLGCRSGYRFNGLTCVPSIAPIPTTPVTPITLTTATPSILPSAVFVKNLVPGMKSGDVRRLQTLLASDKSVYPEGIINGRYGALTQKAVGRFQIKYGIALSPKAPGYGKVGPSTRAQLQKVFGK